MESIGDFQFSRDDVIGRGGFGSVYKGTSKSVSIVISHHYWGLAKLKTFHFRLYYV